MRINRRGGGELELVGRDPEARGFAALPRRWVVERSFPRFMRDRRRQLDDERRVRTSETVIEVAVIRPLPRRD